MRYFRLRRAPGAALALAAILTAGMAAAAELPAGKARAPRLLGACRIEDSDGYWQIPGTNSCLAVGGEIEVDAVMAGPVPQIVPGYQSTVIPRFAIDGITDTEWGLLRAFARVTFTETGRSTSGPNSSADYMFVSLGTVDTGMALAGLGDSVFDFYNNAVNVLTLRGPGISSTMLKYQYTPDEGFGWAISLESDPTNLRQSRLDPAFQTILAPGSQAPARYPNLSGAVQYAAEWGTVKFAATTGNARLTNPDASLPTFAALAGVEFDLKGGFFDGDTIWLQAVGASADTAYLGFGSAVLNRRIAVSVVDAVITPSGQAKATLGAAFTAAWQHDLNDDWTLGVFGSWADVQPAKTAGLRPFVQPFQELRLGTNVQWAPVDNLTMTAEVQWVSLASRSTTALTLQSDPPTRRSSSVLVGLQAIRTF
ncbi:MAG: porin [Alsobacter sp.]